MGAVAVDFNLANIGGPSAGLMFSLAVIDKLTTGDLAGSKFVAGTGTIDPDGKVGPIGGITHKMFAAHDGGRDGVPGARGQLRRGHARQQGGLRVGQGGHPRRRPWTHCTPFLPVANLRAAETAPHDGGA